MTLGEITLENFRGVAARISVSTLRPTDGCACSLVVYGENGSGKSSLCDALEFVARGIVSRRLRDGTKQKREVQNLSGRAAPYVEVTLLDGTSYSRGDKRSKSSATTSHLGRDKVISGFQHCPLVVRRSAIEGFWNIRASDRQDFFWDYLRAPGQNYRSAADVRALAEHRTALAEVESVGKELKAIVGGTFAVRGQNRVYVLPTHTSRLSSMDAVLAEVKRGRGLGKLTEVDRTAISRYKHALTREQALRDDAAKAEPKLPRSRKQLQEIFASAGPRVSQDYKAVAGGDWVSDVTFELSVDGSLEIGLSRTNGKSLSPETVLSEAHLDLLAILVLVEVHVACAALGQERVIVFDDIFQSIDSPLRFRLLKHLAERLDGWQLVMTVHDRLWFAAAARCLKEANIPVRLLEFRNGGFGATPTIFGGNTSRLRDLEHAVATNASAVAIVGATGRTLEALCDHISSLLRTNVRRKARDEYTIGDLWPGIQSSLERCLDKGMAGTVASLATSQFLRNAVGAHYREWADALSETEALDAASYVRDLHNRFWCSACGADADVVRQGPKGGWTLVFRCGH